MDSLLLIALMLTVVLSVASTAVYFRWNDVPEKIKGAFKWILLVIFAIFGYFAYLIVSKKRIPSDTLDEFVPEDKRTRYISEEEIKELQDEVIDIYEEIEELPKEKPEFTTDSSTPSGHADPALSKLFKSGIPK